MKYYIDCEFDGHNGPLLSMAVVRENGDGLYYVTSAPVFDPWVRENVQPFMGAEVLGGMYPVTLASGHQYYLGIELRRFIGDDQAPTIIADSPVDIGRFCNALSTDVSGGWASADYPMMRFEVHNVDCYPTDLPGAVQHNAWWDAMVLRHKLENSRPDPLVEKLAEALKLVCDTYGFDPSIDSSIWQTAFTALAEYEASKS